MKNQSRIKWIATIIISSFSALAIAADTPPGAIHVSGVGISAPSDWTPARLKSDLAADSKNLEYSSHDQTHHAASFPLLALLKASGLDPTLKHDPSIDPHQKHIPLRLAVTVAGRDGYTVTFSLAELLPDAGNHDAYLAIDTDDKPLPDSEVPAKLIVPSDAKPGRWVHGVSTITVVDTTTPQPAR